MMFGKLNKPENREVSDMNKRELVYMLPIILLIIWMGVYPSPFLRKMDASVTHLIALAQGKKEVMAQKSVSANSPPASLRIAEGIDNSWDVRGTKYK
jgi:NADH:ubiquinone oxidoreductase subunit 4 (subunit M)